MHELSIADSLLDLVRRHTPPGNHAVVVRIEAGPLQSIDPEALQMAWTAVTLHTEIDGARLELSNLPYKLACPRCGREWTATDPFDPCACGNDAISATEAAGDIRLLSLEVEPVSSTNFDLQPEKYPVQVPPKSGIQTAKTRTHERNPVE